MVAEPVDFQVIFPARLATIRPAMAAMCRSLRQKRICPETRDRIELAVTEALNNVVLHACRGQSGNIELVAHLSAARIRVIIRDRGMPLPGTLMEMPPRAGPDPASLPENGFGWPMIRHLAHSIRYIRMGTTNFLLLEFRADAD